jgi:hypothetical protein
MYYQNQGRAPSPDRETQVWPNRQETVRGQLR